MGYLRLIGLKIQILASHIHQQTFQMQNTFKVYFTLKMKILESRISTPSLRQKYPNLKVSNFLNVMVSPIVAIETFQMRINDEQ